MPIAPMIVLQLALLGLFAGFWAGLMGVGGGLILVPFMAAFAAGGFALWRVTLSVPAMFCADRLARLLRAAVRILLIAPVGRILSLAARGSRSLGRLTARLAGNLYRATAGRAVRRSRRKKALVRTERARLRLAEDVSFEGEEGTRP